MTCTRATSTTWSIAKRVAYPSLMRSLAACVLAKSSRLGLPMTKPAMSELTGGAEVLREGFAFRHSQLIWSSRSRAASVAPSVLIVSAIAVARAAVSGVSATASASQINSPVGVGSSTVAPMRRSTTRDAQYG